MNASSLLRESSMLSNAAASLLVSCGLLLMTFMVVFVTASLLIFEFCCDGLGDVTPFFASWLGSIVWIILCVCGCGYVLRVLCVLCVLCFELVGFSLFSFSLFLFFLFFKL